MFCKGFLYKNIPNYSEDKSLNELEVDLGDNVINDLYYGYLQLDSNSLLKIDSDLLPSK